MLMRKILLCLVLLAGAVLTPLLAAEENPTALTALLDRIGGAGTADRFRLVVDESLSADGKDVFVITSAEGKPCIKGNSVLSVATGINWYLNHQVHVNLAWNNLTTDLSGVALPVPGGEELHTCAADYRYYLNYCTFSYSMSTWTWERWQQEIDWMALHGINMPLQIVGLDAVWKKLLVKDLGYSDADANAFIAGPCFQAWWGMNNLEGWGGPNPDWWYTRQEELAGKITARMRELGMQPVLPGYAGMVPSDIGGKGYTAINQGNWCGFVRPYILDPNSDDFTRISTLYYKRLAEVVGTSAYYSMDPFHEGANTSGIDVAAAYAKIAGAMTAAQPDAKWVIQYWQWSWAQYNVLSQVDKGKLIVLDLFSDAHTHFGEYQGHDAVYCMLHNFGGRTGFYGRLNGIIDGYFNEKAAHSNVKGIGATPEAIETVPVLYDALFELPWHATKPDAARWLADYTVARYGVDDVNLKAAWEKLRNSSLNCTSSLQGPMEAVVCARPSLVVNAVSSWGGTGIFYDSQEVIDAAYLLLKSPLAGENYSYDLTDLSRQALTDYAYYLLQALNAAHTSGDTEAFNVRRDAFLKLMLDLDELLNTNRNFRLGRWTTMARGIADEVTGTTASDRAWLELTNARRLITTWGDRAQANGGGLRDYSYREWGGMMKDFYYPRWKYYFDNGLTAPDWFAMEDAWVKNAALSYSDEPEGQTAEVAERLFGTYFLPLTKADGTTCYVYRKFEQDKRGDIVYTAYRGADFVLPATAPDGVTAQLLVDCDNDGTFAASETFTGMTCAIPADAVTGQVPACLQLSDGTTLRFTLLLMDEITEARTVAVATADEAQGTATIAGTEESSVTNKDAVTLTAQPAAGYDFLNWTDSEGRSVSTQNPYVYYGKEGATFTAHFALNKWGVPEQNLRDYNDIASYEQYVASMSVTQTGRNAVEIYRAESCPQVLFQSTNVVNLPAGSGFTLSWKDTETKNGLAYCRLSAYIDLNSDGDFDDEGEFLTVLGEKNTGGNTMLSDGALQVLLPYDMPLGLTHLRLRFDSSYSGDWNTATDAKDADAETYRMVYDVLLNVTECADAACTVEVVSSNPEGGTVDANGHANPYSAGVGEDIIFRAYPADGYKLVGWRDAYGRMLPAAWAEGNKITFKPVENGVYTAVFSKNLPETITIGKWEFRYTEQGGQLTLTEAVSGSGALTLPDAYEYDGDSYPIVALAQGLLAGNEALTSVSVPASLTELGLGGVVYFNEMAWDGAGVQNQVQHLETPVVADGAWTMRAHFTSDGSTFNQWGSGLLAAGSNALADSYNGGFQFYLSVAGKLILKFNSSSETSFSLAPGVSFDIVMAHAADGVTAVTLTAADGQSETKTFGSGLDTFSQLSSSIPAGVNVTALAFEKEVATGARLTWTGDKTENRQLALPLTLKRAENWTFLSHVTVEGESYNQWGSCLFATGDNGLGDSYAGGFQFYLSASGSLVVKMDGSAENRYALPAGKEFDLLMENQAGGNLTVTLTNADGQSETKTFVPALDDVTTLVTCTNFGTSVEVDFMRDADILFKDCKNLTSIKVDANNPRYASSSLALYDRSLERLIRYPEGATARIHTLPAGTKRIVDNALYGVAKLERLVATKAAGLAEVGATAFAGTDAVMQVTPAQCAALSAAGCPAPLLVSAAANETVDATQAAGAAVVEVCAEAGRSGAFTADVPGAARWWSYYFAGADAVPVCFPTDAERIVTTNIVAAQTLAPADAFTYYTYADGAFAEADASAWTTVPAGSYMLVPQTGVATGKTVTFKLADGEGVAPAGAWAGNAALTPAEPENAYGYDAVQGMFLPITAVAPLTAYCTSADGEAALPFLTAALTLDETADAYEAPTPRFADVTLLRTFHGGDMWNSLCLPFALTAEQAAAAFTRVKRLDSVQEGADGALTLNFVTADGMEAGQPYLVTVCATRTETLFKGVYLEADAPVPVTVGTVTATGSYTPQTLADNEYFISENTFYYATSDAPVTMRGFRFCLTLGAGQGQVKQLSLAIDGVPTGLTAAQADGADEPVSVYSLSGVLLRARVPRGEALRGLPKGLYLVNGEKKIHE